MSHSSVFHSLSEDTKDFWTSLEVPIIDAKESNADRLFVREGLTKYHPVIIRGLVDYWPAMQLWTENYLVEKLSDSKLSINLTPNGRADSVQKVEVEGVTEDYFVLPAEAQMTMESFFTLLNKQDSGVVAYLSQQNDNLRVEAPILLQDIEQSLPLADEFFGKDKLEAVNVWIGDERSVSSIHKDHFENMYVVVRGVKTFTLLPPTDAAFLPSQSFPVARYQAQYDSIEDRYQLTLSTEGCSGERVEWIHIDLTDPAAVLSHPPLRNCRPLHVTLQAGEVLYIPAMWYHRVSQTERTVAVNFWYDMSFDFRYVFCQLVQILKDKEHREKEK